MAINYAALNAKIAGMRGKGHGMAKTRILHWLPAGKVKNLVAALVAVPVGTRNVTDYMRLWKQVRGLDSANRRVAMAVLGAEIDMCNIVWLYRLKRFHGVGGDGLFRYLTPVRWRLTTACWQQMAHATDDGALWAVVRSGVYGWAFSSFDQPERAVNAAVAQVCRREMKRNSHTIAGVYGYLVAPW